MAQSFNLTARINLQGPYNLRPIISKIKKDIGSIKPQLKFKLDPAAAKSVKNVTAELKKLDAAAKSAKKSVGSLNSQLLALSNSFNAAATASKNAANATNTVTRATANAAKSANQARTAIEEFGKQSGLAIKRFAAFTSVTTVIYGVANAITDAYKEFIVFNKELVRLSQVTNKSVSDLQGISNEITRLSTSLGVTSSDLISVASTLAQAGLSAQDTKIALEALAKSALAPSFENITQTTEGAIAAIRQFGLETRELDSALGSINAVAAAFAVEAGDIIAAIQRTGGVFASASRGVSEGTDALNEFIAVFTSIRQTTRESAETIATGLRTIFTRIQRSDTIELLKQYGVELRDLEGKFVGPYEAVRRLSEGLSKIDPRSADFARISEELGGFRQIGKVIPLIQQFAVAQDALNVAQKGSGSLTKDVQTAQQSLAVQFEKTRQNFLALIREIGDSTSFKVFVNSTLLLTNGLIDLGRILKPLLPLLLTFAAIKAGSGFNQFLSGFGLAFNRGRGGAGGTGASPSGGRGGGGGGSGGNQPLTSALTLNTTATNALTQIVTTLNTSVLALNQNIVNTNSLLLNRPTPPGFASGGLVPGSGNRDTYGAMLTPGEFVIRKKAVEAIGAENLAQMNSGGYVQKFTRGTTGRGVKRRRGRRSGFEPLTEEDIRQLSTQELIDYVNSKALEDYVYSAGAGLVTGVEFITVPKEKIVPEIENDLVTGPDGTKGFWREKVAAFGKEVSAKSSKTQQQKRREGFFDKSRELLIAASRGLLDPRSALSQKRKAAFREVGPSIVGDYARSLRAVPRIKSEGSPIDASGIKPKFIEWGKNPSTGNFASVVAGFEDLIRSQLEEPNKSRFDALIQAGSLERYKSKAFGGKDGHIPPLKKSIYSITGITGKMMGGLIRKYAQAGKVEELTETEKEILAKLQSTTGYVYGQVGGRQLAYTAADFARIDATKTGSKSTIGVASKKLNLPIQALQNVAIEIQSRQKRQAQLSEVEKAQQADAEKLEKESAVATKRVLDFGLVGLRYGTSKRDTKDSLTNFTYPIPPAFSGEELNIAKAREDSDAFLRIKAATVSERLSSGEAENIQNKLLDDFKLSVIDAATKISKGKTGIDTNLVNDAINNAEFYNVIGSGLEAAISLLGAPIIPKTQDTKGIDFPQGLGAAADIFGAQFRNIPTDVTRTIGGEGKSAGSYRGQIVRWLSSKPGQQYLAKNFPNIKKFAAGGSVSSKDTVPALLTPGEFVFSEPAAQRIGYGTLNRLNKADKIQGFNKGGIVGPQRFAGGGSVTNDPAAIVAALTGILIPQIQRLADSFTKLEGDAAAFGAGLGGALREASSLTLSAGIGLRTVGASATTVAAGQFGGAIGGAIGGGLTDTTGKLLEKALLENSKAIGKFEKSLQDIANSPTEELRVQATKDLQQSFIELDIAVRNSKSGIDNLENLNKIGSGITNLTTTILSIITAMSALSSATSRQAAIISSRGISSSLRLIGTFGTIAGLIGTFAGPIGLAITVVSTLVEVWGFFNSRLKSSSEQFDRLNKALDETIKNSQDYNLSNENFTNTILPQFQRVVNEARKQGRPVRELLQEQDVGRSINPLDLRFRQLVIPRAREASIAIGSDENIEDVRFRLLTANAQKESAAFEKIIAEAEEYAREQDAISFLVEKQGIEREKAEATISELLKKDAGRVTRFASEYNAAKNLEILSARLAADSANRVQTSFVKLDNALQLITANINKSLTNLTNNFEDLDNQIGLLTGQQNFDLSKAATRDVSILENLTASSNEEVRSVLTKFTENFEIPREFGPNLTQQVQASQALQKEMGVVLNEIATQGGADNIPELLDKTIGSALRATVTGPDADVTIDNVLTEVESSLRQAIARGDAPKTLQELASSSSLLNSIFQSGERSVKFVIENLNTYGNGLKALGEQQQKIVELESIIKQKTIQRIENEKKAFLQLKEIFDIDIPLSERLGIIDARTRESTRNITGIGPQGTTDINEIIKQRDAAKQVIQNLESASRTRFLTTDKEIPELTRARSEFSKLNQVIEDVASNGDKVNLVFEAIAKQRDQFKTQREVLIDVLKRSRDPLQQAQLQAEFEAIRAVTSGGAFSDTQAFRALESSLLRIFNPQQQESILNRILTGLGMGARPSTPQETSAINQVLVWLQSNGFTTALGSALAGAISQQRTASQDIESRLSEGLNQRINETNSAFDTFIKNLKDAGNIAKEFLSNMTERVRPVVSDQDEGRISIIDTKLTSELTKALDNFAFRETVNKLDFIGPGMAPIQTTEVEVYPLLSEQQSQGIKQDIARLLSEGKSLADTVQFVRKRVYEAVKVSGSSTEQTARDRITFFDEQQGEFRLTDQALEATRTFFDLLDNLEQRSKIPPPTPATRSVNPMFQSGALLDPASKRSIDGFTESSRQLATALTGENNTITRLAEAVNSLTPVINTFKAAAEALAGKIGPDGTITINQQAQSNVSISFDEALQVDMPLDNRGSNNAIVSAINSIVTEKISDLERKIGIA